MADTNFEAIKEYFAGSDPEVRESIAALERALKETDLYGDLAKHDAVKMIVAHCEKSVHYYDAFLRNQSAEKLAHQSEVAKRARYEGYREAFGWLARLFSMNAAKNEALTKKAEELRDMAGKE